MAVSHDDVLRLAQSPQLWPDALPQHISARRCPKFPVSWWLFWDRPGQPKQSAFLTVRSSNQERYKAGILRLAREVLAIPNAPHLRIQLPELVKYDTSTDSILGEPYLLQKRQAGLTISFKFGYLSVAERLGLAAELGSLYRHILESECGDHWAGKPVQVEQANGQTAFGVEPYHAMPHNPLNSGDSVYQILVSSLEFQRDKYISQAPELSELYNELCGVANGLKAMGCLRSQSFCLVDEKLGPLFLVLDLNDGHIIEYQPSCFALIAPRFMAVRPPTWLWKPERISDWPQLFKEPVEDNEPGGQDQQRLKDRFDRAAGPLYMRLAYQEKYIIARRLGWFALKRRRPEESDIEDLIARWKRLEESK